MKKLLLRLLHYVIYASLFLNKFAWVSPAALNLFRFPNLLRQIFIDYFLASLRLLILRIAFLFDDRAVIKGCLDGKVDNAKNLSHVAIVINNLVSTKQVVATTQNSDEVSLKNNKLLSKSLRRQRAHKRH